MRSMFSARKMVNNLGRKVGGLTVEPPLFRPVFVPERRAEKSDRFLANLETSKTGFFSGTGWLFFQSRILNCSAARLLLDFLMSPPLMSLGLLSAFQREMTKLA